MAKKTQIILTDDEIMEHLDMEEDSFMEWKEKHNKIYLCVVESLMEKKIKQALNVNITK